jgi:hypothetical protein
MFLARIPDGRRMIVECFDYPKAHTAAVVVKYYGSAIPKNGRGAWPNLEAAEIFVPVEREHYTWEALDTALERVRLALGSPGMPPKRSAQRCEADSSWLCTDVNCTRRNACSRILLGKRRMPHDRKSARPYVFGSGGSARSPRGAPEMLKYVIVLAFVIGAGWFLTTLPLAQPYLHCLKTPRPRSKSGRVRRRVQALDAMRAHGLYGQTGSGR